MILHRKIYINIRLESFFSFVDLDTGSIYIYIYSLECLGLYVDKSVGCFFFESSKVDFVSFFGLSIRSFFVRSAWSNANRSILVSNFTFVFHSSPQFKN